MKIAIVHDFLNQYGGAEKVVEALHEMFPDAPVFTSIYLPDRLSPAFRSMDIRTSFMQNLPFLEKHFKKYLLFFPRAFEQFDFDGYDVVLSSSSAFAKGVRVPPSCCHICYCYTPMRFAWNAQKYLANESIHPLLRPLLAVGLIYLKRWDLETAKRVHHFVAISQCVADRISRIYGRPSDVIYPPVSVDDFQPSEETDNYFLIVSRLNAYKKIDFVVEAFNSFGLPLVVIGEGPYESHLKRIASRNIRFLGKVGQTTLMDYVAHCRAFVLPGEEDFGIAPVEAMAAGRPVIAYASGGALETVVDGKTGVFFSEHTDSSLKQALERFQKLTFDPDIIRTQAGRFDKALFQENIRTYIIRRLKAFQELNKTASIQT